MKVLGSSSFSVTHFIALGKLINVPGLHGDGEGLNVLLVVFPV